MQKNCDAVAIYSRKSRFTGKGESIGNQVDLCRSYIRTVFGRPYDETAIVFEDEGFSGGNLNRPGFKKLMAAAREHRFKAVVVYRLDRISRSISDFSALIEDFNRLHIDFVSIRENFDTSSPMGRAMMYIASVFSQLERETIAERIRDNMHELAKTGRWLGGTTPTGYASQAVKNITLEGKSKKSCRLQLVPQEADTVRTIFSVYRRTHSLSLTEQQLQHQNLRTKNGRSFTRFSIRSILQNPVYSVADQRIYEYFSARQADVAAPAQAFDGTHGIMAYNRTAQEKGKPTVYLPVREWIVSVGLHPGIISSDMWIDVQTSLEQNSRKDCKKPRSSSALLSGLLYCRCGSRMYPKISSKTNEGRPPRYSYVCKAKAQSRQSLCSVRNVSGIGLDSAVADALKDVQPCRRHLQALLEQGYAACTSSAAQEDELDSLQRRQKDIGRRLRALVDALSECHENSAASHIHQRIQELDAQSAALKARAETLENLLFQNALSPDEYGGFLHRLSCFEGIWDDMCLQQKRAAAAALIQKVVWDGRQAHLFLYGAAGQAPLCEDGK